MNLKETIAVFGNKNYPQIYSNISIAFAVGGAITSGGWEIGRASCRERV